MRPTRLLLAAAAAAALLLPLLPARAGGVLRVARMRRAEGARALHRSRELIVQFRPTVDDQIAERAMRFSGGREARRSAFGTRFLLRLEESTSVTQALARLTSLPEVDYAEPNGVMRAFQGSRFTPNDFFLQDQWHLHAVDAERTWAIQRGDPSVAVAVIDTGIAFEDFGPFRKAPDFGTTVFLPGRDFVNGDDHANDDESHGTHVASTIAEATNNREGGAGLAFGCSLMPLKVLAASGEGSDFDIADAIDYAIGFTQNGQRPVKVINMSLGGEEDNRTLHNAVDRAFSAGITVVAATGNDGLRNVSFPAAYSHVIGVGALDGRKRRAPYSNFGPGLSVMAPGGDFDRDETGPGDRPDGYPDGILQQTFDPDLAQLGRFDDFAYWYFAGTSMATPHVAAVACLLYRQGITDPAAIRAAIEQTAEDLGSPGRDDQFGFGMVRPAAALSGYGLIR